jgi:hypothetical protein
METEETGEVPMFRRLLEGFASSHVKIGSFIRENNREKKETKKMPAFRRLLEGFMRCMRSHVNMVILGLYFCGFTFRGSRSGT